MSTSTPKVRKMSGKYPMRRKPSAGRTWWIRNQVKNLDALSSRLDSDLEPYLGQFPTDAEWSPVCREVAAAKLLRNSLLKKYEWESSEAAEAAALAKFLKVNDDCRQWALDTSTLSDEDHLLLGEVKLALYKALNPKPLDPPLATPGAILAHAKVGPGASLGANGNGFYTKLFSSQLTCTSEILYKWYSDWASQFPLWTEAEKIRAGKYGVVSLVKGNQMCFVPKNVDISRVICVEPSLNMYYQLGVKHILERLIRRSFGIDFTDQQAKNRDLAQLASMFDRQWVTIDLSSASDSMSLKMLRYVLPRDVYSTLCRLRSPEMTLPDGSQLELEMISTMGNGFTFPLQTLLFLCVVRAAHRVAKVPFERPTGPTLGNFGVYGDDIICRTEVSGKVLRLLQLLGFTVNSTKSFFEGPFRESCGGDFYKGRNVRGVYIDRLRSTQDAYVAINALNRWTSVTGISLPRSVRFLISLLRKEHPERDLLYVPLAENDDAGIKVPRRLLRKVVQDPHVQSVKYRRYVARPAHIHFGEDATVRHPFGSKDDPSKGLVYNPPGLYVAFLSGNISGIGEGVRQRQPLYRTEPRVTPNWDYTGNAIGIAPMEVQLQLGTAVELNTGWN